MIEYVNRLDHTTAKQLIGFFVGWPKSPSPETHLKILKNSEYLVLAIDNETGQVVGFINAISDRTLSAYIPLLEVLPEYQKRGIGRELVRRLLDRLKNLYMIDLMCDRELESFYSKSGMRTAFGMMIRNFDRQSGE